MEAFRHSLFVLETAEEAIRWIQFDFCQSGFIAQLVHRYTDGFQSGSFLISMAVAASTPCTWTTGIAITSWPAWTIATVLTTSTLTAFMPIATTLWAITAAVAATTLMTTTAAWGTFISRTSAALERGITTHGWTTAHFPGLLFLLHKNPAQVGFEV